ncbi:MAG: tol-pal system protein YbgF [Pseudomonadota bacterium]
MHTLAKRLVTGGLVILTGPFCLGALAQTGYVDVEAERAAREASGQPATPADPYGAQPAQAYPATSYGVSSGSAAAPVAATPVQDNTASGGSNLGSLFFQVQQLQQEVRRLNGMVEEQAHELRLLKEQSMQRYIDLDKRIAGGGGAAGAATAAGASAAMTSSTASSSAAAPPAPPPKASDGETHLKELPGEKDAYDAAYSLVVGKEFDQALNAFQQFLREYPGGRYSPNAYYWLGELYLVMEPADLEASRQSFALLLSEYPDNYKAPDALYKLGKVQFMKGNRDKAREYLDLVVTQYSSTNSPAVKLAKDFIAENY